MKEVSAYKTIGEVSKEVGIAQHVLRFWEEKFSQIKPVKRRGGHRYYRPDDITSILTIKDLLHNKGYTIKGAKNFLSTGGKAVQMVQTSQIKEQLDIAPSVDISKIREELLDIRKLLA